MTIFTVGHSTRSAEDFLALLTPHRIQCLVDVRLLPGSRRHPQFNADALATFLKEHGIAYRHMPALGGRRKPLPNSVNTGWRNDGFRGYADYMQTPAFDAALDELLEIAARQTTVIMCRGGAVAVPSLIDIRCAGGA